MFLLHSAAALVAKVASASTVVQAATGLGIAVVGVTGAGAVGVLPGTVQDGVASAIEAVTPFDAPRSSDDRLTRTADPAETDDSGLDGPGDGPGADPTDIPEADDSPSATPTATPSGTLEPDDDGGVHQHRGGRTTAAAPTGTTATGTGTDDSGPGTVSSGSGRDHPEDDGPSASPTSSTAASSSADDEDDSSGRHGRDDDDSAGHGGRGDASDDD